MTVIGHSGRPSPGSAWERNRSDTAGVPEQREPVPDQQNRNRKIVDRIDAGDRLDRDGYCARQRGRSETLGQSHKQAFQRDCGPASSRMRVMSSAVITATKMGRSRMISVIAVNSSIAVNFQRRPLAPGFATLAGEGGQAATSSRSILSSPLPVRLTRRDTGHMRSLPSAAGRSFDAPGAFKPRSEIGRLQTDGHAIMNGAGQGVRVGDDDRTTYHRLAGRGMVHPSTGRP